VIVEAQDQTDPQATMVDQVRRVPQVLTRRAARARQVQKAPLDHQVPKVPQDPMERAADLVHLAQLDRLVSQETMVLMVVLEVPEAREVLANLETTRNTVHAHNVALEAAAAAVVVVDPSVEAAIQAAAVALAAIQAAVVAVVPSVEAAIQAAAAAAAVAQAHIKFKSPLRQCYVSVLCTT